MKKTLAIVLALVMVLAMATSCSSASPAPAAPAASAAPEASAPAAPESAAPAEAAPATDWPGKQTIQIIVPYNAGGDTDYNARLLADKLSAKTGATFVVTNVGGNGGATGSLEAKNAPNDGSTILFHHTAFLINNIYGSTDFLFDNTFDFCAVVGRSAGNIITMNSSYGITDLQGLIDYTKAHPGELKFTANTGATTHATALFLKNIGCDIQLVDAGSASERIASLLGGHVDIIDNAIGTISDYLKTGELVAICSDSDVSNKSLKEMYNIGIGEDQGFDIGLPFIYFMAFPAGTDPPIIAKMSSLLGEIITTDADYAQQIESTYCQEPLYLDTVEGKQLMMDTYDKLSGLDFGS